MFGNRKLEKKLQLFQETRVPEALDNSDSETDVLSKDTPMQQIDDEVDSTQSDVEPAQEGTSSEIAESEHSQHSTKERSTRRIQRWWPRDPEGPNIPDGWPGGKMTSNGNPQWGATMLSFFSVNRVPSVDNFVLFSSASRLAAFMRKIGDKECAWCKPELDFADNEEEPRQIFPVDIGGLILNTDRYVRLGLFQSMSKQDVTSSEDKVKSFLPPSTG